MIEQLHTYSGLAKKGARKLIALPPKAKFHLTGTAGEARR
jgi:hypothetical protein